MTDPPGFAEIVARLRALLHAEYRRGQADAARRIIEVAQADVSPASATRAAVLAQLGGAIEVDAPRAHTARRRATKSRRAPIGVPDSLLKRVLTERGIWG
jgi:hypothetical protein